MRNNFLILLILLSMNSFSILSQETNYWYQNFGAFSSLKGGIETAGISNPAAIFYNPGALVFIEGSFFDGQADVISVDGLNINNIGGDNINLKVLQMDIAPSIFVMSGRFKNNQNLSYSFGVLTRYSHNYSFGFQHEQLGNYLLPVEKEDILQGQFRYENRIRESWAMGAISYKINNSIGIGLSTNLFVRSQDFFQSYMVNAYHKDEYINNELLSKQTSTNIEQRLNYRVMGFIFKPGIKFDLNHLKLGVTFTSPSISLGLLNNNSNKSQISHLPDVSNQNINESNYHNFYNGVYKTPFSVNIGGEYQFDRLTLSFSGEWFAKIEKYNMIKKKSNSEDMLYPTSQFSDYAIPVMANKSIINLGFSVVYQFKPSLSYIGSFRTDYSFFDNSILSKQTEFVPYISDWDVFHFTSGIVFTYKKANITFGADYAHGKSSDNQQYVNLTNASQENQLIGEINNSAKTVFNSINFSIGLNIEIGGNKEKKDSHQHE